MGSPYRGRLRHSRRPHHQVTLNGEAAQKRVEGGWTPQLTLGSHPRWLLPPQALNAYYLPNKNQMGKGRSQGQGLVWRA